MLVYVESKMFPRNTFVLLVNPSNTIARARAKILHILYEMGKSDLQFRFRFQGTFLRDAYTFEDYKFLDSSIIKMVPMAKTKKVEDMKDWKLTEALEEVDVFGKNAVKLGKILNPDEVQRALLTEVKIFNRREKMLSAFRVLLWLQFLAMLLSPTTAYPYAVLWIGCLVLYGFRFCPNYTRVGGFVGRISMRNETYLLTLGAGAIVSFVASSFIAVIVLLEVTNHGCDEFFAGCSHMNVWSVVFHVCEALALFATILMMIFIYRNFRVQEGDIVEYILVRNKDLTRVLEAAKSDRKRERRNAAFDLASLVVTGDDIKYKLEQANGIEVLMNLAVSEDEATQEYATEAIAELVTIESIQSHFIELGGARVLCALLHSNSARLLNEAVMAISFIVANSDVNRQAIVAETGISDLASAIKRVSEPCQRIIGGIFLELTFNSDIRMEIAKSEAAINAMQLLSQSRDEGSKRFALQTFEMLAIERSECITERDDVLDSLISICLETVDDDLQLLAGKILCYYAESETACHTLMKHSELKTVLVQFAMSPEVVLQSLASKLIISLVDSCQDRQLVISLGLIEPLSYMHTNCLDREAWELSEHAIDVLHGATPPRKKISFSSSATSTSSRSIVKQ